MLQTEGRKDGAARFYMFQSPCGGRGRSDCMCPLVGSDGRVACFNHLAVAGVGQTAAMVILKYKKECFNHLTVAGVGQTFSEHPSTTISFSFNHLAVAGVGQTGVHK